jgi:hypothetical protein
MRGGRVGTWKINIEERERVRGDASAGQSRYRFVSGKRRQGYRASIDPIASGLSCRACIDLRSLVYLASCSGGFLREQMRGFHDLLKQNPISLFILLG